jgi:hypothetical protein
MVFRAVLLPKMWRITERARIFYSEFLKRHNVRHTWMCNKCDYEFETLIWLNIPPGGSR